MKNEDIQQLVFSALGGCSWEHDLETNRTTYSEEFFELLGYGPEGRAIDDAWIADNIHPKDLSQWREAYIKNVKGESRYFDCELRFRHRDDYYIWIQTRGAVIDRDAGGRAKRIVGLVFDIGERKGAKDTESRYRLFLDNIPDAISLKGRDHQYFYINRRFEEWLGKPSYEIYGKTAEEIFHPDADTLHRLRDHERRVWEHGETISEEREFPMTPDGKVRHAVITKFPVFDETGKILAIGTTNTDITARYRAQEALRLSEQRYRHMFEAAPVILAETDWTVGKQLVDRLRGEGVDDLKAYLLEHPELLRRRAEVMELLTVNQEALRVYKVDSEAGLRRFLDAEMTAAQRLSVIEDLVAFAAGNQRSSVQTITRRGDGDSFPITRVSEMHNADPDDWSLVLITIRDDSAEAAVRDSERRYRGLFESAPVMLVETDWSPARALVERLRRQGVTDLKQHLSDHPEFTQRRDQLIRIKAVNRAALRVFEVDSQQEFVELLSGPLSDIQRETTIEEICRFDRGIDHGTVQAVARRKGGELFPVIRECQRFGDDPDDWSQVLIAVRDISIEERVRLSEKRFRQMFELAPAVLAETNWTPGKRIVDGLRAQGVEDLRQYLVDHPELTRHRGQIFQVNAINQEALRVYKADNIDDLVRHMESEMNEVQRLGMIEDLVNFANGQRRSAVHSRTLRLNGEEFPIIAETEFYGSKPDDWSRVLLTIRDISVEEELRENEQRYRTLFESAPATLCEIDWSRGKKLVDELKSQGVSNIRQHLYDHPELIQRQDDVMLVSSVNQEAVRIFRADGVEQLIDYSRATVDDAQRANLIEELSQLAAGQRRTMLDSRHTRLDGENFPVIRECELLGSDPEDWSRGLLTMRDISAQEAVRLSEMRYRRLFESAPVALYESDWSRGKALVDAIREQGVTDLDKYIDDHPEILRRRDEVLSVIDLNREALSTYHAVDKQELIAKIEGPLSSEQRQSLKQTLLTFADGNRRASVRSLSQRVDGESFPIIRNTELISSDRDDWSRVLSSIHDLTEEVETANRLQEYQEELRLLAGKISAAEESERRRISSELHDGTIQNLVLARIHLANLRSSLPSEKGQELADSINDLLESSLRETRSLIFEISPPVLYELGLEPAVEWLAEHYKQRTGVTVEITSDDGATRLSQEMNIVMFQSARELLVNIAKHAQAKHVAIDWRHEKDRVILGVRDDGVGFDVDNPAVKKATEGGFGLFAVRERLKLMGANLQIESSPGGSLMTITAPVEAQQKIA